jgi:type IV pilus assembly protein PilM
MAAKEQLEMILQRIGLAPGPGPARLKPRLPPVAVQVLPGRVSAVRLAPGGRGSEGRPLLAAYREIPLAAGAVAPSLTKMNLPDPGPVAEAVAAALSEVAPRESRLSLVVPDTTARVSILKFNRMPATRREVLELIRFRLQRVLPFRLEEAALDFQLLSNGAEEPEFLVALAQRTVLWQYERLLTGSERLPGQLDLESFNLVNLIAQSVPGAAAAGDEALVNLAPGYLSVLFFRDGRLSFCRTKALADEETAAERLVAALRRELASCAAYYREHLSGSGLSRAILRMPEGDRRTLPDLMQEELGCPSEILNPARAVTLPASGDPADPKWQRLAPAIGAALGRKA